MASRFTVTREATIAAPAQKIFDHLVDLHRWVDWSPWEGRDPDLKRTYEGPNAGVGASYAWVGNRKVGAGRMDIVEADAPRKLGIKLTFLKPFKAVNDTEFRLAPDGAGTRITWEMSGPMTLIGRIFGLFMNMDKMIGKDFEAGLAKLKALVEK